MIHSALQKKVIRPSGLVNPMGYSTLRIKTEKNFSLWKNFMGIDVMASKKTYNVAVVGATGAVGLEIIKILESRNFPVNHLRLFASDRFKGKHGFFKEQEIQLEVIDPE